MPRNETSDLPRASLDLMASPFVPNNAMQNKSPLTFFLVLIALAIVVLLSHGFPEPSVQVAQGSGVPKTGSPELANYGKLPLYFFENQGRLDPAVKYYIPGGNKNVYFAPSGVFFELFAAPGRAEAPRVVPASYGAEEATPRASRDRWAVKLGFVGANPNPLVVGGEQAAEMNFFRGDRASWRTGVPAHKSIRYERLWPGIDLLLKAEGPHLKSLLSKLDSGYGNLDSMQAESPQSVPGVGRQKPLKQAFWGNRSLTEGGLRRAA